MTTLQRINTAKFKEDCEDVRYSLSLESDEDRARDARMGNSVHDKYRVMLADGAFRIKAAPEFKAPTYEDFRAELAVAARAAYLDGASQSQVEYLAKLAVQAGEQQAFGVSRLTKAEASRMINEYLKG